MIPYSGYQYIPKSMPAPHPSRPMRNGSVFSLEERRADSPSKISSSLSMLGGWKKNLKGKEVKLKRSDPTSCFLLSRLPY